MTANPQCPPLGLGLRGRASELGYLLFVVGVLCAALVVGSNLQTALDRDDSMLSMVSHNPKNVATIELDDRDGATVRITLLSGQSAQLKETGPAARSRWDLLRELCPDAVFIRVRDGTACMTKGTTHICMKGGPSS